MQSEQWQPPWQQQQWRLQQHAHSQVQAWRDDASMEGYSLAPLRPAAGPTPAARRGAVAGLLVSGVAIATLTKIGARARCGRPPPARACIWCPVFLTVASGQAARLHTHLPLRPCPRTRPQHTKPSLSAATAWPTRSRSPGLWC